jgi:hypothetical protein
MTLYSVKEASKIVATKSVQHRPSMSEINTYIFTNAFVSMSMDILGVSELYLKSRHV